MLGGDARSASRSERRVASHATGGGVDLLLIETAQDILEVKAAVSGAR